MDSALDWTVYLEGQGALTAELEALFGEYQRVSAILDRLGPAASFSERLRAQHGPTVDPQITLSDVGRSGQSGASRGSGHEQIMRRFQKGATGAQRYEPRREIARGGMGAIIEVWDGELRRTLAMKMVLAKRPGKDTDESEGRIERRLSRFLEEAQITGQLDHPGIVPVHDIGIDDQGHVFYTMQLVNGFDLRQIFEFARLEHEGWNLRRVVGVMVRVCEAMAYAHAKGVVHRDLKPGNIMVGSFGEAFVMDWGLAKVVGTETLEGPQPAGLESREESAADSSEETGETAGEEPTEDESTKDDGSVGTRAVKTDRSEGSSSTGSAQRTLDGDVVGTPAYMAPEQARGDLSQVGPRSDVYAIGAMLYHLLSGHMPYEPLGEKVTAHTILDAVRSGPPWPLRQLNPDVNEELAAICAKAMERDSAKRYGEVQQVGEDLRAWVEGRGVAAYTSGLLYEMRKWMERNKATTGALIAILVLSMASVLLFIWIQKRNLTSLEEQQTISRAANTERDQAQQELTASLEELRAGEQSLSREAERARLATSEARANERKALLATERATQSAVSARESEGRALSLAYRSSLTAAAYSLRLNANDEARRHLDKCSARLRGWEWDHLRLATDASVGTPIVQERGIEKLAISADGSRFLSYGFGLPARIWLADSRRMVLEIGTAVGFHALDLSQTRRRLSCDLSPSGDLAVVANGVRAAAQAFDGLSGTQLGSFEASADGPEEISDLVLSADGRRLVTISRGGVGQVFDVASWELLSSFIYNRVVLDRRRVLGGGALRGELVSLALSPDGALAAAGTADGRTLAWDLASGEEILRLSAHVPGLAIRAVDISADGRRLLSASEAGSLAVWDMAEGSLQAMMRGHDGAVLAAIFSEDGQTLISGGADATIRSWEASSGRELRVITGHAGSVQDLVLLGDSQILVSASLDETMRFWDLEWNPALTLIDVRRGLTGICFDPDGRRVHVTPSRRGFALDLDAHRVLPAPDWIDAAVSPESFRLARVLSPDGKLLALSLGDRTVLVFNFQTGEILRRVEGLDKGARQLAFSADSRILALGGGGLQARVIDLRGDHPDVTIAAGENRGQFAVRSLDLSPDGTRVATVDRNEDLRLWDARSGKLLRSARGIHDASLTAVAFSPDGSLLVTASKDQTLKIFGGEDLEELFTLEGHRNSVQCITFSPDGTRLASGGDLGEVYLWSVDEGALLISLEGVQGTVLDLEFSPNGERLVACGRDFGLAVWESAGKQERYANLQEERHIERGARRVLDGLFASLCAPDLVGRALLGDQQLESAVVERALLNLEHLRDDLDYCAQVAWPHLLLAATGERELRQLGTWLEGWLVIEDPVAQAMALRGALELRLGAPQAALEQFAAARKAGRRRALDELFVGLAQAQQGEFTAAQDSLELAHEWASGEPAALELTGLTAELEAALAGRADG